METGTSLFLFTQDILHYPEDGLDDFDLNDYILIAPLETQGIRTIIKCPNEIETSTKPLKIQFTVGYSQEIYACKLR